MIIRRYDRKGNTKIIIKRREITMAVLATNKPNMLAIKEGKMKAFIKESNKNKISDEFLEECRKAAKLFRKKQWERQYKILSQ